MAGLSQPTLCTHGIPLETITKRCHEPMLLQALDYAQSVGMDHVTVVECKLVEEYRVAREDDDNEDMEGEVELEVPC